MMRKIRYLAVLLVLGLLAFMSQASIAPAPFLQPTSTPGPKARAAIALAAQAGKTDLVVVLGILIFAFIVIPITLRYKNLRTSPESSR